MTQEAIARRAAKDITKGYDIQLRIEMAIKEALAQAEPFGYFKAEPFGWTDCAETDEGAIALYQAPPQRTWVDLTRTQIQDVYFEVLKEHRGGHQIQGQIAFGEALQAKIKESNT